MNARTADTIIIEAQGDPSVGIEGTWLELRGLGAWLDGGEQEAFITAELTTFFSDLLDERVRVWLPSEDGGAS